MKKLFFAFLLLMAQLTAAVAQNYGKMSFQLQKYLGERQQRQLAKGNAAADTEWITMLAQGDDDVLRPYSISHQGDIHIVCVPADKIAELSEDSRVRRMEADFSVHKPMLDKQRVVIGADLANSGFNLPQAFDGTGVVVGTVDMCFELTHPTFRSAKDGRMRIVRFWDALDFSNGEEYNTESKFPTGVLLTDTTDIISKRYSADATMDFHGTETASISSGSGLGTPYQGIATESDIYLCTTFSSAHHSMVPIELKSKLNQQYLLAFENILAYADSVGKPCVVNYSAGRNQSFLDGDKLAEEYIARITGPGKIVVAAAGNTGILEHNYAELRDDRKACGGRLTSSEASIYFRMKTRAKLKLTLRKHEEDSVVASREFLLDCVKDGDSVTGTAMTPNKNNKFVLEELDGMTMFINPGLCGLDNECVGYEISIYKGDVDFESAVYTLELEIVDGENYADMLVIDGEVQPYEAASLDGFVAGCTVSSPSSLPSVIGVGATQWRNSIMSLSSGKELTFPIFNPDGKRAFFSSVGPSLWGITKPEVVAPGTMVISALNKVCDNLSESEKKTIVAEQEYGGEKYYYMPGLYGTSLSSPFVAGAIALWMQADPTLTRERILDIIARTSRQPDPELDYPNNLYGYGEIDIYAGLLDILGLTNVEAVSKHHLQGATAVPTADGNVRLTFSAPTDSPLDCRVYSTGGSLLTTVTIPTSTTTFDISLDRHSGIVAVQVGKLGSTLVRL